MDFDGVLNNESWIHAVYANRSKHVSYAQREQEELNPEAVKMISDLAKQFDAKIVVSSSWRITHTLEELQTFLYTAGLDPAVEVIDVTPRDYRGYRGAEVAAWLRAHPEVKAHVIFDDDRDFEPGQPIVITDWQLGLLPEHIEKAKIILGADNETTSTD